MTAEKRIGRSIFAMLCAAALSLGSVFCLKTAFLLKGGAKPILWACILTAVCAAALLALPKGGRWLGGVCGAGLLLGVWKRAALIESARCALKQIYRICGENFENMTVLSRRITVAPNAAPTAFLAALGALLALLTAVTVCRRWTLILPAVLSGGLFAVCMLNLYPAPAAWAVALLAGAYGALALTQARRRRNTDRPFQDLLLVGAMTLLLAVLLLRIRPAEYTYPQWPDRTAEKLWEWGDKISIVWDEALARMGIYYGSREDMTLVAPSTAQEAQETDLRALTARTNMRQEVFAVMTDTAEDLYLRGSAYSTYTGDKWKKLVGGSAQSLDYYDMRIRFWTAALPQRRLRVESETPLELLYVPYGSAALPEGARPVEDAYVFNAGDLMQYEIPYGPFSMDEQTAEDQTAAGDPESSFVLSGTAPAETAWYAYQSTVRRADVALPAGTQERLLSLLEERGIVPDGEFLREDPDRTDYEAMYFNLEGSFAALPESDQAVVYVGTSDGEIHPVILGEILNVTREEWEEKNQRRSEYRRTMAEAVAALVRKQGKYDLSAASMPKNADDFALWFMTEGETGYCVHYASAAAVLLRALNVPARFVTGYMVTTTAGRWTTVTQNDAHAWAEYYIDGEGWIPLETTPGADTRAALSHPRIRLDRPNREFMMDDFSEDEPADPAAHRPETPNRPEAPGETGSGDPETPARTGLSGWLKALLAVIGMLALWQIVLRLWRRKRLTDSDANRRAQAWYRHIRLLARLSDTPVSQELEEIALRARFSQHTVTDEELRVLEERADALREWLLTGHPLRGVLWRILLAI